MSPAYLIVYLWWTGVAAGSSAATIPMPSMDACRMAQQSIAGVTGFGTGMTVPRAWTHCLPTVTP